MNIIYCSDPDKRIDIKRSNVPDTIPTISLENKEREIKIQRYIHPNEGTRGQIKETAVNNKNKPKNLPKFFALS